MRNIKRNILIFILAGLICFSCSSSRNYEIAYAFKDGSLSYIKLKGKRPLMAHDPLSINQTYTDSLLIQVPTFADTVIQGKNIPVKEGYYSYSGSITINKTNLSVNLMVENTDDKITEPLSWNGKYKLIIQ